jgi:hypothetical protein
MGSPTLPVWRTTNDPHHNLLPALFRAWIPDGTFKKYNFFPTFPHKSGKLILSFLTTNEFRDKLFISFLNFQIEAFVQQCAVMQQFTIRKFLKYVILLHRWQRAKITPLHESPHRTATIATASPLLLPPLPPPPPPSPLLLLALTTGSCTRLWIVYSSLETRWERWTKQKQVVARLRRIHLRGGKGCCDLGSAWNASHASSC